jgi:hypothetical protein
MAKKAKKTVKAKKAGSKPKRAAVKSTTKKKVVKAKPVKAKKSSAASKKRTAVKVSKPRRKAVAPRKAPVAAKVTRPRKIAKSQPVMTNQVTNDLHVGMLGDGTEEQNLNQPGNPGARVSEADVDAAFKKTD